MSDERCDLTELLVSACACREHRGDDTPKIETVGQAFEAWYPGQCVRCDDRIRPGQTIARVADGSDYVHAGQCP